MGRKKITMELIQNEKQRRLCFKKRRIGTVKKLMELCQLTGCKVDLKIYQEEDLSLLEYKSEGFLKEKIELSSLISYLRL